MSEPIVIRKSPIRIIRNIIISEFAATLAYFLAGVMANYGEIYQQITFSQDISYEIAKFVFVILAELLLLTYIFLRWIFSIYTIFPEKLIVEWGVIFKRRKAFEFKRPLSVSCQYGPLSQLFKYGTLIIKDASNKSPFILTHVPSPKTYLRLIMEQEKEAVQVKMEEKAEDVKELLKNRERENLEFKSSFRWDMEAGNINKNLEKSAMKTVAAFLNSEGGHLVIGVDDRGQILGVGNDYSSLKKTNADGFENHFTNVFKETIGPEFRRFLRLSFHNLDNKEICAIKVMPAASPAYMKFGNEEVFYIRTGNSTTALQVSEVANYVRTRWGKF